MKKIKPLAQVSDHRTVTTYCVRCHGMMEHDVKYPTACSVCKWDFELYDEICRTFADTLSTEKMKVEINRARRIKNFQDYLKLNRSIRL